MKVATYIMKNGIFTQLFYNPNLQHCYQNIGNAPLIARRAVNKHQKLFSALVYCYEWPRPGK